MEQLAGSQLGSLEGLLAPLNYKQSSGGLYEYLANSYLYKTKAKRVANANANKALLLLPRMQEDSEAPETSGLVVPSDAQDLRTFDPEGLSRRAWSTTGKTARIGFRDELPGRKVSKKGRFMFFRSPAGVTICIRRKARREVMHALGYAGGRVNVRYGRLEPKSRISCVSLGRSGIRFSGYDW